jgi:hypothetical protein
MTSNNRASQGRRTGYTLAMRNVDATQSHQTGCRFMAAGAPVVVR